MINFKKIVSGFLAVSICLSTNYVYSDSQKKYAYSIGVSYYHEDSETYDNFITNVTSAKTAFSSMPSITKSYLKTTPTFTYLKSSNPNGYRVIGSDIVFLNSHANPSEIVFKYESGSSVIKTGVTKGADTSKYVGISSTDMSNVDLISFVGCSTASGSSNLTRAAITSGANAAVGFDSTISSRTSSGKLWLESYVNNLADGASISYAVYLAGVDSPNSSLKEHVCLFGLGVPYPLPSNSLNQLSPYNVNYPERDRIKIQVDSNQRISTNNAINAFDNIDSIIDIISDVDKDFSIDNYKVSKNVYNSEQNTGAVYFTYYINDFIKTNKCYSAYIENGQLKEITSSLDKKTHFNSTANTEELAKKADEFMPALSYSSQFSMLYKNYADNTKEYVYDYETNTLSYIEVNYTYGENGEIIDHVYETIIE